MLETFRCRVKGHVFVDSRSQPGMQVCVRCRHREPFEGLSRGTEPPARDDDTGASPPP